MSNRHDQQAAGTHPAPCARHCEAPAFKIEIRRLEAENKRLNALMNSAVSDMNRCYKMLLSEPDTKGALFKAENILHESIAQHGWMTK